jgi:hypothetical protein
VNKNELWFRMAHYVSDPILGANLTACLGLALHIHVNDNYVPYCKLANASLSDLEKILSFWGHELFKAFMTEGVSLDEIDMSQQDRFSLSRNYRLSHAEEQATEVAYDKVCRLLNTNDDGNDAGLNGLEPADLREAEDRALQRGARVPVGNKFLFMPGNAPSEERARRAVGTWLQEFKASIRESIDFFGASSVDQAKYTKHMIFMLLFTFDLMQYSDTGKGLPKQLVDAMVYNGVSGSKEAVKFLRGIGVPFEQMPYSLQMIEEHTSPVTLRRLERFAVGNILHWFVTSEGKHALARACAAATIT